MYFKHYFAELHQHVPIPLLRAVNRLMVSGCKKTTINDRKPNESSEPFFALIGRKYHVPKSPNWTEIR